MSWQLRPHCNEWRVLVLMIPEIPVLCRSKSDLSKIPPWSTTLSSKCSSEFAVLCLHELWWCLHIAIMFWARHWIIDNQLDLNLYYPLSILGGRHSESESKPRLPLWLGNAVFPWSWGKVLRHNSQLRWRNQP